MFRNVFVMLLVLGVIVVTAVAALRRPREPAATAPAAAQVVVRPRSWALEYRGALILVAVGMAHLLLTAMFG